MNLLHVFLLFLSVPALFLAGFGGVCSVDKGNWTVIHEKKFLDLLILNGAILSMVWMLFLVLAAPESGLPSWHELLKYLVVA